MSERSYHSQQEADLMPSCILQPRSTSDVATGIRIMSVCRAANSSGPQFAIRSGGHMAWAGAANIGHGVTFDLQLLRNISVAVDRRSALIGAGARWGDVYTALAPFNLAVTGGRASTVGVGGLILGGGLSYFGPRYGFACDNVLSFEVVLADGSIANVSEGSQYRDLFVALKGGSQNFGIVTRFQLFVFRQGQLLGGNAYYNVTTAPQQLKALYQLNGGNGTVYDEYASVIQSYALSGPTEQLIVNQFAYTKPVALPSSLSAFRAIPSIGGTIQLTNLTALSAQLGSASPNGFRELYMTTTFHNSLHVMAEGVAAWNASLPAVRQIPGIVWTLNYEPIPTALTSRAASKGGNSLGLTATQGNLMLALLTATWNRSVDDGLVHSEATMIFQSIDQASALINAQTSFRYLNYASKWQRPIDSYGPTVKARLQAVSRKYDPTGLFQQALSGSPGFKVCD